ncbi:MAG: rRNA maturation RNase YbeY [Thermomicrobiales bacterium]
MEPLTLEFSVAAEAEWPRGLRDADLESLCAFTLTEESARGAWEIVVALVSDWRLQDLHREFMGIDSPTDIMTFPYDQPGRQGGGGDLVISVDHALSQSAAWGLTPAEEVEFLVVHGTLHLLGWSDEDDAKRERMLARQGEIFDRWRARM